MARISRIKKSRVERRCHAGHVIPVGSAYSFAAPGYHGREIYACGAHPFRPSNLTTGLRAEAEAAREAFTDTLEGIDHEDTGALEQLESALEEFKSEIGSYRDQRQEALDAWENGNSQLEELLETAEAAADELEGHEVDEWDGDESERDWTAEDDAEPEVPTAPYADEFEIEEDFELAEEEYQQKRTARDEWEEREDAHEEAKESWRAHVEDQVNTALELAEGLEF